MSEDSVAFIGKISGQGHKNWDRPHGVGNRKEEREGSCKEGRVEGKK
jgi:hypothetical protein